MGWVGWEIFAWKARQLHDRLLEVKTEDVPAVIADMGPYRLWLSAPLRQTYTDAEAEKDDHKQLHASLALAKLELVGADEGPVSYLYARLFAPGPQVVVLIRDALRPHSEELTGQLWSVFEDVRAPRGRRLRAACALAEYAPEDIRWQGLSDDVMGWLLAENELVIGRWAEALK